ncbi:hypothetical protein AcW2_000169 [Taiwanofungus camphoratus]|nr:hypothetical protein AcW2_000169 [Antrodia cinnamomea]
MGSEWVHQSCIVIWCICLLCLIQISRASSALPASLSIRYFYTPAPRGALDRLIPIYNTSAGLSTQEL